MMEKKVKLKTVNCHIICKLCQGYLIEATTITECLHTFCKSCLVKYFEDHNTCPKCGILIHQSHPLNYISHDRTMQDIVYKLVPNLQEKEAKRQQEFYKKQGINIEKKEEGEEKKKEETQKEDKEEDKDYHRSDEQLNVCLECKGSQLKHLKRRFLRLSSQATVCHLKKFIALKVYNDMSKYTDVEILCNDELLGKYHTLKFVAITRWRVKDGRPLTLHYRKKTLDF
ncbi:hypothetical protein FSP39_019915 [Pinctada imbricata]|uniref:RING-type domain-containing protein n=1 Tax=Pinctada imbricata TaxID=66713 RepID=A0AA88YB74_PINIB|nr:hypothetical protein FSP39_019915 [Pinctada imbricata]